jgi:hypothetical protein
MKKFSILLALLLILAGFSYSTDYVDYKTEMIKSNSERVSFKIKGTGSKNIPVTIGIGIQPGSGACCSGVSPSTTASFVGNVGEVVYDGKTRRIITKIYKEMNGTTIDLAQYY